MLSSKIVFALNCFLCRHSSTKWGFIWTLFISRQFTQHMPAFILCTPTTFKLSSFWILFRQFATYREDCASRYFVWYCAFTFWYTYSSPSYESSSSERTNPLTIIELLPELSVCACVRLLLLDFVQQSDISLQLFLCLFLYFVEKNSIWERRIILLSWRSIFYILVQLVY